MPREYQREVNVAESNRENQPRGQPPQSEKNAIAVAFAIFSRQTQQVLRTQLAYGKYRLIFSRYRLPKPYQPF
ncbi:MAG: hypothetical protein AAGE84_10115 [Cyanobacteria bacterium P01_G01_bin.39]